MDQAIEPEGTNWIEFPANNEDKTMKTVELELAVEGRELYLKAHGRFRG